MIPRHLAATVRRAMKTFPAVLVTGPRQSGKTTLLRAGWGRSHRYVSLENIDARRRAAADPVAFLEANPPPCIIDEFQYVPEILTYIKTAIDEDRAPGRWLLTGSQHFPLMQGVSQSLAGRVAVLSLLPLSMGEVAGRRPVGIDGMLGRGGHGARTARPPPLELGDWIVRGAYPEIRANKAVDRQLWCGGYVQTYLERDVRNILNVGDLGAFDRFLRLCAARTGQLLNYSDLARDTGVSVPTAQKWMSVLVASYQVHLLPPYHSSVAKRLVKSPKLYFIDTGLAAFLTGQHDPSTLLDGPQGGAWFETMVCAEWLKVFFNCGEPPAVYFWRSLDGLEIDFVIERNGALYPFEAKLGKTVSPADAGPIERWRRATGQETPATIIANVPGPLPVAKGVTAVPWHSFSR